MKVLVSSKKLKQFARQIARHCKNLDEQPLVLIIENDMDEVTVKITSSRGEQTFQYYGFEIVKPEKRGSHDVF